jgi:cytochrome c2
VNRQINYIIYAFILLTIIAGGLFFVAQIPVSNSSLGNDQPSIPKSPTENTVLPDNAAKGKALFMSKCAICHNLFKNMTGPGLLGFEDRGPWANRENVYAWIHNPAVFMEKNSYARNLKFMFGSMMTAFPELTNDQIDVICDYINHVAQIQPGAPVAER